MPRRINRQEPSDIDSHVLLGGGLGDVYGGRTLTGRFTKLLEVAHEVTDHRVVVLVDDYDKPLIDAMGDDALVEHNRRVLRGVYSVLSAADEHLESVFVTGVSSRQTSGILPALDHMPDVSLFEDWATVCGFTDSEIRRYLAPEVERLATNLHKTTDEALRSCASATAVTASTQTVQEGRVPSASVTLKPLCVP